jgi:hypothetical protein
MSRFTAQGLDSDHDEVHKELKRGITLLKHEPSAQSPWQKTMLGLRRHFWRPPYLFILIFRNKYLGDEGNTSRGVERYRVAFEDNPKMVSHTVSNGIGSCGQGLRRDLRVFSSLQTQSL